MQRLNLVMLKIFRVVLIDLLNPLMSHSSDLVLTFLTGSE